MSYIDSDEELDHEALMDLEDREHNASVQIGRDQIVTPNHQHSYARSDHVNNPRGLMESSPFSELPSETSTQPIKGKKQKKGQQLPPPPPPPVATTTSKGSNGPKGSKNNNGKQNEQTNIKQQQQQQSQTNLKSTSNQTSSTRLSAPPPPKQQPQSLQSSPLNQNTNGNNNTNNNILLVDENSPQTNTPHSIQSTTNTIPSSSSSTTSTTNQSAYQLLQQQQRQQHPISPQQQSQQQQSNLDYSRLYEQNGHTNQNTNNGQYNNTNNNQQYSFDSTIVSEPIEGKVDTTLQGRSRPTQSIKPSPLPPDLTKVDIPIVQRSDLSFHVEDPFPVLDNKNRIVYYFPIIITTMYVSKAKSPLAMTYNSYGSNNNNLSTSTSLSLPQQQLLFPTQILNDCLQDNVYRPDTYAAIPRTNYQTYSWTINIRFSEFDAVYQRLAQLYPTLSPQLSKLPDPASDIIAIKRRQMLQDLIHALYDVPFVIYTPEFLQLFLIPAYIILIPLYPHLAQISYDLYGNCFRHYVTKELNGFTRRDPQKLQESTPSFSSKYSFGFNQSTCFMIDNVLFTTVQYNDFISKTVSKVSSWFSTPSLVKKCDDIKKAYGGVIAWIYKEHQSQWTIHSILPLDTNVDTIAAQQNHDGSSYQLCIGCANGQLVRSTWSSSQSFTSFDCIFAHSNQICGLYFIKGLLGALISVSRDGTVTLRPSWQGGKEETINIGETLLSSAFVHNRYLILGADSGYICIIDCFYQNGLDNYSPTHTTNNNNYLTNQTFYSNPTTTPQQQTQLPQQQSNTIGMNINPTTNTTNNNNSNNNNNANVNPYSIDFIPTGELNPKMIYYAQHHSHGIRYISTTTITPDTNSTFFQSNRYDALIPYNDLRHTFDTPYNVQFSNTKTIIQQPIKNNNNNNNTNNDNDNNDDFNDVLNSYINSSIYSKTNSIVLFDTEQTTSTSSTQQNQNQTSPQQHQQQQLQSQQQSGYNKYPTYIITCSHDGTNKVFLLNQIFENCPQHHFQQQSILPYNNTQSIQQQQQYRTQNIPQDEKSVLNQVSPNSIIVSNLHVQSLLLIETLKAHQSHCATWCEGTNFFITAHDETIACRIAVWDSNALKKGPIVVFNTETTQITSMIWFTLTKELMTMSRDGVVKIWALAQLFHDYHVNCDLLKP